MRCITVVERWWVVAPIAHGHADRPVKLRAKKRGIGCGDTSIVRFDTNLAPRFICLLALMIATVGCTSLQWRDSEGVEHHMGLLMYELKQWEYGSQLRRVSFGIDVRLSGADRGISFGLKKITGIAPRTILMENAEELPGQVAKYFREALQKNQVVKKERRGFFYLDEDLSRDVTIVDAQNVGAEWASWLIEWRSEYRVRKPPTTRRLGTH